MEDRIRVLNSIKSKEELESYEKYLDRYLTEYNWFVNSKEPLKSIKQKALQYDVASDARNALESRARLIEIGEYGTALERNITSYLLAIEEYKAKQENKSPYEIIKGIIQKDEKTMEYLKNRYMKSRADDAGLTLATPVNINLPSKDDVLTQVFEECDFIRIQKPVMSLVPVSAEDNKMFTEVRKALSECLKQNGIDVDESQNYRIPAQIKEKNDIGQNYKVHTNNQEKNKAERSSNSERGFE